MVLPAITLLGFAAMLLKSSEHLLVFTHLFVYHFLIAFIISAPLIYFGRRRSGWRAWEMTAFAIPFLVWAWCMIIDGSGKSLANLVDFVFITAATPVAVLVRVVVGRSLNVILIWSILLVLLCAVAVATYLLVPSLPE